MYFFRIGTRLNDLQVLEQPLSFFPILSLLPLGQGKYFYASPSDCSLRMMSQHTSHVDFFRHSNVHSNQPRLRYPTCRLPPSGTRRSVCVAFPTVRSHRSVPPPLQYSNRLILPRVSSPVNRRKSFCLPWFANPLPNYAKFSGCREGFVK